MTTCTKCNGGGLIGNGPEPWLKQGHVTTCDICNGTGSVSDTDEADQPVADAPIEAPVDTAIVPEKHSGILSIFRRR